MEWADVLFELEVLQKIVFNRACLPIGADCGDHEVVCQRRDVADVQQNDVGRLFFFDDIDDSSSQSIAVQKCLLR